MSEEKLIRVEYLDGGVVLVTMDRPPLNLLNLAMLDELRAIFTTLGKEKENRAVVLTSGIEKSFSAGYDTKQVHNMPKGSMGVYGQFIMNVIENCPLPIIAAINGYAFGGGLELALACDIRIAAEEAQIGLTEVNLGLIGGWGGATRLPLLIGEGNAKYMFYTSSRLSGQEAKEFGLAQKCVPKAQLLDTALDLARLIATKAPMSISSAKRVCMASRSPGFGAGQQVEMMENLRVSSSKDCGEGVRALKEKRTPHFNNE